MTTAVERDTRTNRREQVAFYHPNTKGTGAVTRFDPCLGSNDPERPNCFFLEMAGQKTVANREDSESRRATFDWENKITVQLGFLDVCEFLAVLEGRQDRVGGKRDGLFHRNGSANTVIRFTAHDSGGYALALSRKAGDNDVNGVTTILSTVEACGLGHVLRPGLFFMAVPQVMGSNGRITE